jgi:hypothetical protein
MPLWLFKFHDIIYHTQKGSALVDTILIKNQ